MRLDPDKPILKLSSSQWRLVASCVVFVMLLLCGGTAWLYRSGIPVNTNPMKLLSEDLPFQKVDAQLAEDFPTQQRKLVIVIDGRVPESVEHAVIALQARLSALPQFENVQEPMGGEFFEANGLLYRDLESIDSLTQRLAKVQLLMGSLNHELSVKNLCQKLGLAIPNMDDEQLKQLEPLFKSMGAVTDEVSSGKKPDPISWQALFSGGGDLSRMTTRVLSVKPNLDYGQVLSAGKSIRAIRKVIGELEQEGLLLSWQDENADYLPRVGLTGDAALSHEEMKTVVSGLKWGGPLSLFLVLIVMILGYRSLKYVAVTLISLLVGLVLTAGVAWLVVGRLNMISIAFAMLYVGLGVDFALHFLLHLRENTACQPNADYPDVVHKTVLQMAMPLLLCGITTALGFFAFSPTAYVGVSELGMIAGSGMLISFVVTITLAPALMFLLGRGNVTKLKQIPQATYVIWIQRNRGLVLLLALLAAGIAGAFAWQVDFDADPISLRDPQTESVRVTRYLLNSGDRNRHQVNMIAKDQAELSTLVTGLKQIDAVDKVISLDSLVPGNQAEKLEKIQELSSLMGLDFMFDEPEATKPVISDDASDRAAILSLLAKIEALPVKAAGLPVMKLARETLANAAKFNGTQLKLAGASWLSNFPLAYKKLIGALSPVEIKMASLPEDIREQWVSQSGAYLISVIPKADVNDNKVLGEFIESIATVTVDKTGGPVRRYYARLAIIDSFRQAFIYALIGISVILLIELRSLRMAFLVLIPMLLGGGITLGVMVLIGIDFNFANVIALPLLLGIGVDSGIHMVHHHHPGRRDPDSPGVMPEMDRRKNSRVTIKAIFLSCVTTVCSFGNLGFSPHPGTASMGQVLAIGTLAMLICTLGLLPALLGGAGGKGK